MILGILDATGIQRYIFGSNRLRENLGASQLVHEATGPWVEEVPKRPGQSRELLWAGGGNAVLRFDAKPAAEKFGAALSLLAAERAPGLELAWYFEEVPGQDLNAELDRVMRGLAAWKGRRPGDQSLLALPVVATCQSTRGPAVGTWTLGDSTYRASAEVLAKVKGEGGQSAADRAIERLKGDLTLPEGYVFPTQFEDLGRTEGVSSYLGVVHADGNGIGQRFGQIGAGQPYETWLTEKRKFSTELNALGLAALKATLEKVGEWLQKPEQKEFREGLRPLDGGRAFPVRPIVYGGDDVTLVCDGRLALGLAALYLREFARLSEEHLGRRATATASAGVAVVKVNYPFAQAYDLAGELTASAKRRGRELSPDAPPSCLDWHFAATGTGGGLKEIRQREYTVASGDLRLRPLVLDDKGHEERQWATFKAVLEADAPAGRLARGQERQWATFKAVLEGFRDDEAWEGKHNKLMALREALRGGPDEVKAFRERFGVKKLPWPEIGLPTAAETGWYGNRCTHFDALEALDFSEMIGEGEG